MKINIVKNVCCISDEIYNLIASRCEFFKDQNGEIYIISYCGNTYELVYLSQASAVKSFIRKLYFNSHNATVKSADVLNVYDTIAAVADGVIDAKPVYPRVAFEDGCILYDLNNTRNDIVKINSNGVELVKKTDVVNLVFSHDITMKEQILPVYTGYTLADFVNDFINIDENQKILLKVYICTTYLQHISHPILILEGEKGSGKTYFFKLLMALINPVNKDVFVMPESVDNLITVLSNNHFSAFDNIGTAISNDISNILCQASTGGTLIKRKFYSNNEEFCVNIKRIVALNGINLEISQSDLLDRSILVKLCRISESKRRTNEELQEFFDTKVQSVLADIFDILSRALKIYPTVNLKKYPRMADFAKYGYAIAEAMGEGNGEVFLKQYTANVQVAVESVVGENLLLDCVKHIAYNSDVWKGSMTQLLKALKNILPSVYIGHQLPASFPKTANALSRRLNTFRHELEKLKIKVEIGRSKERYVVIERICDNTDDIDDLVDEK